MKAEDGSALLSAGRVRDTWVSDLDRAALEELELWRRRYERLQTSSLVVVTVAVALELIGWAAYFHLWWSTERAGCVL